MNKDLFPISVPLWFSGMFLLIYIIVEQIVPSIKEAGVIGHFGLPLVWSLILTPLLWVTLEQVHIIPKSLSLIHWSRQEWNPTRMYSILIVLSLLFVGLAMYFILQGSRQFILPFFLGILSLTVLLFYWWYRLKILNFVIGTICILLGLIIFATFIPAITRENNFNFGMKILLGTLTIVYGGFILYVGKVLIRQRRNPEKWHGSWRSFAWGFLIILSFNSLGLAFSPKGAFIGVLPISVYLLFYSVKKFLSSIGTIHTPEMIDSYTTTTSLTNFLRFSLADRWRWEESRQPVAQEGISFTSIAGVLFDVLSFGAIITFFVVFSKANIAQQIVFAMLVIVFHIAANLSEYSAAARDTVAKERAQLEQELRVAHDMQMSLMPTSDPVLEGYEISGRCLPASEVGGDYFDYLWMNEEKTKLGIAIADVSGHAMKAAITAVMTSGMVYNEIHSNESPRAILRKINRPMYLKTDRRIFTALSFAVIDIRKKELTFSNAGQMTPLLRRGDTLQCIKVEGPRLPLGVQEVVEYNEVMVQLQSGDILVLFTDGMVEAKNTKEELWGFERMEEAVKNLPQIMTAKEMGESLIAEANRFAGTAKQYDDMTIVVVRVL